MRKLLKWIGIVLGGLVALALLIVVFVYVSTSIRFRKTYNVSADPLVIPTDAASVTRGEHLVISMCTHCHGSDLSGQVLISDPMLGTINALNLTPGEGGAGSEFTDADWVRALRHGVNPEGHSLIVMPSNDFNHFSDSDLGAIIAYLKTLPPVDKSLPEVQFKPVGVLLVGAGAFGKVIVAEEIDHVAARPTAPQPGVSAAYGEYLVSVSGCKSCHGVNLTGGQSGEPGAPPAPDISASGELRAWSDADFITTIRTGQAPSGHKLTDYMPWEYYRNLSDEELKAIFAFLQSLPGK
jgi:mono/diheme cytochrome c family protein